MGFFDERVLTALKDGKPRGFTALLGEVGFSHNTLQQHLKRLMAQGLIVREKAAANSFGRPKFASKSNFNWSLSQMYDNKITPARVLVHKQFLRFFAQLETFRIRTSQLIGKINAKPYFAKSAEKLKYNLEYLSNPSKNS